VRPRVRTVNLMNDDFPPLPPQNSLILVFCMRLFYFVRCWPPAYGNSSSGQKNTSQMGFEPMITCTYRPHPNHYRLILVFCMRLFYFVRCWPPAYGNSSSGQKNTSQMGFEPMITGTYRPHPNHYTTCPVLVLTCLIFFLYVN
jgi:hypothetical protein